jgi:4,5-DOPA dioxygenase extradiol
MVTMPTLFLSHGSPLQARSGAHASKDWAAMASRVPRPRAIVMFSAHWESHSLAVSADPRPETVHDYGGFPPDLYRLRYEPPGSPQLAQSVVALLHAAGLSASAHARQGLDHGAWVPLRHMFPQADIPVVQVSLQPALDAAHHLRVGRALAPLLREEILLIGSGHMTHNLMEVMTLQRQGQAQLGQLTAPAPYVQAFRQWVDAALRAEDDTLLARWEQLAPEARRAHPTVEHFLPLLVARAAAGPGARVEHFDLGVEAYVLALDAYAFHPAEADASADAADASGTQAA